MFDEHARQLMERLPLLPGLNQDECRRALSAAYARVVEGRLNVAQGNQSEEDLIAIRIGLRRMVDALESVAVFDPLNGVPIEREVANASAFTAAEALAMLALLPTGIRQLEQPGAADPIRDAQNYCRIEAGLLYLISGYDINAVAVVRDLPDFEPAVGPESLEPATARNASYLISRLRAFCDGDVRRPQHTNPYTGFAIQPDQYDDILIETRLRCYQRLSNGVNAYLDWLAGGVADNSEFARAEIELVRNATQPREFKHFTALSDVNHLASLILAAVHSTSERSVIHKVPPPVTDDFARSAAFQTYLKTRAIGTAGWHGRPFLWPSAKDFVTQCLPGPKADAVVAMPTGSGKSFVAELAIADALTRGSVIYLAPTNALVHQIRRDLRDALAAFEDVDILAFLGGGEYSAGLDDLLGASTQRFVAVMTPEKCSLALRLSRPAFADLALCVFDECHLLNEPSRGVTVDILIAQLFAAAPNMSFVLMSAMISNPEELAGWLASARQSTAIQSVIKWRPSRTLRGLLGIDHESSQANATAAAAQLRVIQQTSPSRVNRSFSANLSLLAGLSGPWHLGALLDYRIARLPLTFEGKVTIRNGSVSAGFDGWKNDAARVFAEALARSGIPVITFILQSRHYAFSQAAQVTDDLPDSLGTTAPFDPLVAAWLDISKAELGVETELRPLLRRGVAVHTSAMLQTEQAASEWMFKHQKAKLMFATPTLAQGLNLPSIGVVIAGTSMGGGMPSLDSDEVPGLESRTNATILNCFGRAGRPGFANQGVAVLVGDDPVLIRNPGDATMALQQNAVLGLRDAAVQVHSPIEGFLDRALLSGAQQFAVTDVELELTTLLAESPPEDDAGQILKRTFAAYRKRDVFTDAAAVGVRDRISAIKDEFLAQAEIPAWLNLAATQSGVDVFRARRLWDAYRRRGLITRENANVNSVEHWLAVFLEVMRELPPARIGAYLATDAPSARQAAPDTTRRTRQARSTVLTKLRDAVANQGGVDEVPWPTPTNWHELWLEMSRLVWAYMRGHSLASLCAIYWGVPESQIGPERGTGKPIPSIFSFIRKVTEPLARDAGCFVALNEHALKGDAEIEFKLPESLQALPLCIRNGCDSLNTLTWFRFGYRQRVCAHRLAANFPIPSEITNESERANWTREVRRGWLNDVYVVPSDPDGLLASAKIVIQNNLE
jgi:hypothetical protein